MNLDCLKATQYISELVGVPCKHRGRDRDGLDCYGLIWLVYHEAGIKLPDFEYSTEWKKVTELLIGSGATLVEGEYICKDTNFQPGDILFFKKWNSRIEHLGLFIGDTRFLHCLRETGVVQSKLKGPWKKHLAGGYRIKKGLN